MQTLFIVFLCIAVCMATIYVIISNGQKTLLALSFKCIASFCFVFLALIICYIKGMPNLVMVFFTMGRVASCFGDVILGLPDMPEMRKEATILTLIGGLSFAVAHICYLAAMIIAFGFEWWIVLVAIALGLIFFFGNKFIGKLDYGKLTAGMPIYSIFVSLAVAESIMALTTGTDITGAIMLLVGFILFWLSDIVLMNIYFGHKTKKKKVFLYYFNLAFYYAGQILIAASLMFLNI